MAGKFTRLNQARCTSVILQALTGRYKYYIAYCKRMCPQSPQRLFLGGSNADLTWVEPQVSLILSLSLSHARSHYHSLAYLLLLSPSRPLSLALSLALSLSRCCCCSLSLSLSSLSFRPALSGSTAAGNTFSHN